MNLKSIENSVKSSIIFLGLSSIFTVFYPIRNMRINNTSLYMLIMILSLVATFYIVLFFFMFYKSTFAKYKTSAYASLGISALLSISLVRSIWTIIKQFLITKGVIDTGSPSFKIFISMLFSFLLLFFFLSLKKEYPIKLNSDLDRSIRFAIYSMGIIVSFFFIILMKVNGILPGNFLAFIFNKWIVIIIHILNFTALYYFFHSFYKSLEDSGN